MVQERLEQNLGASLGDVNAAALQRISVYERYSIDILVT